MNRRWQKEGVGRYSSLEPFGAFASRLLGLQSEHGACDMRLCDPSDAYAAYSHLHSKGRGVEVAAGEGFIYFITQGDDATKAAAAAIATATATAAADHDALPAVARSEEVGGGGSAARKMLHEKLRACMQAQ